MQAIAVCAVCGNWVEQQGRQWNVNSLEQVSLRKDIFYNCKSHVHSLTGELRYYFTELEPCSCCLTVLFVTFWSVAEKVVTYVICKLKYLLFECGHHIIGFDRSLLKCLQMNGGSEYKEKDLEFSLSTITIVHWVTSACLSKSNSAAKCLNKTLQHSAKTTVLKMKAQQ